MTETCQNCARLVEVGPGGKVINHLILDDAIPAFWENPRCPRSGHPSREELARRKVRRADKRAALVAELQPDAAVTLDVLLEGRRGAVELLARVDDMRRAALYEYNRRNKTRHRHPYATEPGETERWPVALCVGSVASTSAPWLSERSPCQRKPTSPNAP